MFERLTQFFRLSVSGRRDGRIQVYARALSQEAERCAPLLAARQMLAISSADKDAPRA